MKFRTSKKKNKNCVNLSIWYEDKTTEEIEITKFIGLQTGNNLN